MVFVFMPKRQSTENSQTALRIECILLIVILDSVELVVALLFGTVVCGFVQFGTVSNSECTLRG